MQIYQDRTAGSTGHRRTAAIKVHLVRAPSHACTAGSVANVLQKQMRWNLISEFGGFGQLVDSGGNGVKLGSLQISPLGPCNLLFGRASGSFSADDIAKRHALIGQRYAMRTPQRSAVAALAPSRPCLPA